MHQSRKTRMALTMRGPARSTPGSWSQGVAGGTLQILYEGIILSPEAPCKSAGAGACSPREGTVPANPIVAVVDDDASLRAALKGLLRSVGLLVEVFESAEELLASGRLADTGCLVLDVRMPGLSGLELQAQLIASGHAVPIIFITAHGEEDTRRQAIEAGALDFLQKPFSDDALLNAIARVIDLP